MPRFDSDMDYYQWHRGGSEFRPNPADLRGVPLYLQPKPIVNRDPGDENDTPEVEHFDLREHRQRQIDAAWDARQVRR